MVERFEAIIPGASRLPIILNALIVGALILMLWLIKMSNAGGIIPIKLPTKFFSVINTLVPLAFFAVYFFLIFIINIYSVPIGGDDVLAPAVDNNVSLDQYYYSNENQHLLQAQVRTVTWGRVYPEDLRFCLDVIDEKTGEVIGSAEVPANQMPNNDICSFDVSGIELAEDHWYIFRLFAKGTIDNEEQIITLLRSVDGTAVDAEHYTVVYNSKDDSSEECNFDVISKITSWG